MKFLRIFEKFEKKNKNWILRWNWLVNELNVIVKSYYRYSQIVEIIIVIESQIIDWNW